MGVILPPFCPILGVPYTYSRVDPGSYFILTSIIGDFTKKTSSLKFGHGSRVFDPTNTDYHSSYDQLLAQDGLFRIHHRNLQRLAI